MDWITWLANAANVFFSNDVAKFGITFSAAALLHAHQVKKEIALQMDRLKESIDNVAQTLGKDLASQSERIGNVEKGMSKLSFRVVALETKK